MAKGYWIAHVDVDDLEAHKAYFAASERPFDSYGARFRLRSGRGARKEGAPRGGRAIIEGYDGIQPA